MRCGRGALLDVAVDIRRGSPTYGLWVAVELSAGNGRQLWIPEGFAHGFLTLEDGTEIVYKCTDYYDPADEGGLIWNDPDVDIPWPIETPLLSAKDQKNPSLKQLLAQAAP